MKDSLASGLTMKRDIRIDKQRTIDFMGDDLRVYATPSIVADMEYACRDLALEHLDDNEDTVGTRVEIDHIGASLLDTTVNLLAKITGVEGRQINFEFFVEENGETIAHGIHQRFVVDMSRMKTKLAMKRSS